MNNDAISRSAVLPALVNHNDGYLMYCDWHDSVKECQSAIDSIPAINAVPVVHYQDTGSTVIKAEDINEWQDRIIIDEGESHSCAIYYKENENTVDVVRCRDCKHWVPCHGKELEGHMYCEWAGWLVGENAYCVYGERKGHADNYPSGEQ